MAGSYYARVLGLLRRAYPNFKGSNLEGGSPKPIGAQIKGHPWELAFPLVKYDYGEEVLFDL